MPDHVSDLPRLPDVGVLLKLIERDLSDPRTSDWQKVQQARLLLRAVIRTRAAARTARRMRRLVRVGARDGPGRPPERS